MSLDSHRLAILTDKEIAALYGLPRFTEEERPLYFDLSGPERAEVASHSTSVALHLILQLGYFKARQQFFAYDLQAVFEDLRYIYERYFPSRTFASPGALSRPTHLALQQKILALCDYRVCDSAARDELERKAERIALLFTQPLFILREVLQYLTQQRLIAPPYSFLQDLVGKVVTQERNRITGLLEQALTPDIRQQLDALLQAHENVYRIRTLKQEAQDFTYKALRQEVERRKVFEPLYAFARTFLPSAGISQESGKYYASLVTFYTVFRLQCLAPETTRLYLLCFAYHRFRQINDTLVEAFLHLVDQYEGQAKQAAEEARQRAVTEIGEHLFDKIGWEWSYYTTLSPTFKRNLRHLFTDLDFGGRVEDAPLLEGVTFLQGLLHQDKSPRQANPALFPTTLIPKKLQRYLFTKGAVKEKRLEVDRYEFLIYRLLRNALEAGDNFVQDSIEFRRFEDDLISETRWQEKERILQETGAPLLLTPIEETLRALQDALEAKYQAEISGLNMRLQRAMTETHHRVKNSLQVMSALVDIQLSEYDESVPVEKLQQLNLQFRTLATVHDILTQQSKEDAEGSMISARLLLEQLIPMLQHIAVPRQIHYRVEETRLPSQRGISLALIVNELVLNALKHGKGDVEVTFRVCGPSACLEVCDDGEGLPANFDPDVHSSTGIYLVENLAKMDLKGIIEYQSRQEGPGARISVTFPIE